MYAFKVPDIGEGVVEAEVLQWRVAEGDVVQEDQVLVELLTDKAEIEIPSPRAGRVHRIHFEVGETARVGDVLIELEELGAEGARARTDREQHAARAAQSDARERGAASETAASKPSGAGSPAAPAEREPTQQSVESPSDRIPDRPRRRERGAPQRPGRERPSEAATPSRVAVEGSDAEPASGSTSGPPPMPERPRARASIAPAEPHAPPAGPVEAVPAVRELATRLGVDLRRVRGTGPRGRIMRRDVEAHLQSSGEAQESSATGAVAPSGQVVLDAGSTLDPAQDPPDWTRQPLRGLRRAIAQRMSLSRRTAAHFTYVEELDLTRLLERAQSPKLGRISPLAFIAAASVRALGRFPILNASIDDARGEIVMKGNVHLGIAAATEQGLVVPVIRDAARKSVSELADEIRTLGEGAKSGSLGPSQLRGSTFTITSLGKLGGVISTPILNPPEVAILGVNAIRALPRVVDGEIVARSVMNLSLSVDHRIADGMIAAQFIQEMKRILEAADFDELRAESSR